VKLLPSTLAGRLALILLSGLLVAQLLGAAILLYDRAGALYEAGGRQAAQRIASIVRLLDTLTPDQRRLVLPAVNTAGLRVALIGHPGGVPADVEERGDALLLRALLVRALGQERALRVAVLAGTSETLEGPWPMHPNHVELHRRFFRGAPPGAAFAVQAQLADGQWVSLAQRVPEDAFAWPYKLLIALGVLLASVVALSLVAVRWVTRPLAMLGRAAEALGRDIERPPLAETGSAEVRQTARAFNTMQARLARFLHERARMLAAVSHDLKTPITRLRLRAELIEDAELKERVLHDLDEMDHMTRATLEFLRDSSVRERVQPIDMSALLESLQADAEAVGQAVRIEGAASAPFPGRPLALQRCLRNLIDNAVKYGGRADLTVRDDSAHLRIAVADDGPGIPEDRLEQVFEPFYRLEASRSRDTGGVGLGLSIARDIARAHGGELVLRNRAAGGLDAILTLPR
jgi:signal transduction histidine kinase